MLGGIKCKLNTVHMPVNSSSEHSEVIHRVQAVDKCLVSGG